MPLPLPACTVARKYLFGPVPSRRLGRSLGIDLVPFKTCTLNCVYCECGATSSLTSVRAEYVPTAEVLRELGEYLSTAPRLDHVTFSGSGEPTLHSGIGTVLSFIKTEFPRYRTALLTNGTLFTDPRVRGEVLSCDVVVPSLDAVSREVFARINRPATGLRSADIVEGLLAFSREYRGTLLLELFIVPDINDNPAELDKLKEVIGRLHPAEVQLNTLDRPGAEGWVKPATAKRLGEIAGFLAPLPVRIIARTPSSTTGASTEAAQLPIIEETIRRRPCTLNDIASVCGISADRAGILVKDLLRRRRIRADMLEGEEFYRVRQEGG